MSLTGRKSCGTPSGRLLWAFPRCRQQSVYILDQEKHHAKKTFAEEWKMFLDGHGLELDD